MIRVAIDGPAGVGKSSTSKALAKYYGFAYLDTGAMYRACAWWCMNKGIDLDAETIDEQLVTETVGEFFTEGHFDISVDPDDSKVYADGEDISDVIRSSEVSSHVSKVSNIIPVRHVLIAAQRAYIAREAASVKRCDRLVVPVSQLMVSDQKMLRREMQLIPRSRISHLPRKAC